MLSKLVRNDRRWIVLQIPSGLPFGTVGAVELSPRADRQCIFLMARKGDYLSDRAPLLCRKSGKGEEAPEQQPRKTLEKSCGDMHGMTNALCCAQPDRPRHRVPRACSSRTCHWRRACKSASHGCGEFFRPVIASRHRLGPLARFPKRWYASGEVSGHFGWDL